MPVLISTPSPAPKPDLFRLILEFSRSLSLWSFRWITAPVKTKMMNGGANLIFVSVPRLDHLFRQLGLGPFLLSSRPTFIRCIPRSFMPKPRSCLNPSLSFLSISLCRFMEPIVRRHRLGYNQASLLCWYKPFMITWPLETPSGITRDILSLKKNAIMTPSPRSGGYRSSPLHQLCSNLGVIVHVKKIGIMIPSPRSGDYRNFFYSIAMPPPIIEILRPLSPLLSTRFDLNSNLANSPLIESLSLMEMRRQSPRKILMDLVWNCHRPSRTLADSLRSLDFDTSLILKFLKLFIPLYHHSPKGMKLGLVLLFQCQTDYKLCLEFLNLHGQWLHGREDPPVLLRFCIYNLPFSFTASLQKVSKVNPMLLNLHMLARSLSCVSSMEHSIKSSYVPFARAVYDHLLVKDFAKPVFNIESATVPKDFSNNASFSKFSIPLENSWNPYLSFNCITFVFKLYELPSF